MDATNLKELNRPKHRDEKSTGHNHSPTAFPPVTSMPIKKINKYVFCHQLDDISTMASNGNLCSLVNCSGTEPHTEVYTEKPSYRIAPYDGS